MTGGARPLLSLRGVAKRRESAGARFELRVDSLDVVAGERVALVGESGSGKSTLLDLLALASAPDDAGSFSLETADDGSIDAAALWRARDGDALAALRARNVGYVPQTGGLFAFLTVFDNIDLPRRLLGMSDDGTTGSLARKLGVADHLRKKPAALSVGQRQRVAIARALAHGPSLVLADEPTASVDPATADLVTELLLAQTAERGAALILASHDWARVERLGLPRVAPEIERRRDGDAVVVRSTFARTP